MNDREAFERIERQFTSLNSIEADRAVIRSEDWEAAKRHLQAASVSGEALATVDIEGRTAYVELLPNAIEDYLIAKEDGLASEARKLRSEAIGVPVGVVVKNEAGALAAVHGEGEVVWLDDCQA